MWIKCHDGLMRGAKRGLSRATRFIYLELCQEARDGRGTIALPLGMDAVDAVADLLGGNRGEIEAALPKLCAGAEPMVRIEGPEGELRLVVVAWEQCDPGDTWSRAAYAQVFARDGLTCRYCGRDCSADPTIDHVRPRCQGGGDGPDNLAVACRSCNSRKGGRTPAEAGMVLR